MEAQAFAAASEQLSLKQPEYSARWGMNAKQRVIGFCLTIGYAVWLWLAAATSQSTTAAIAIACMFAVIIAMRFWTVIAALMRKPAAHPPRVSDGDLPTLSVLVPLYREAERRAATHRCDLASRLSAPASRREAAGRGG